MIEIVNADLLINRSVNGQEFRQLKNNVVLKQGDVTMHCDSADFYNKENKVIAYSSIRITQGDSVQISGKKLEYSGDTRKAVITGDVVCTDPTMRLTTDRLDYDMKTRTGFYLNGGTITDAENKLTSKRGYYYAGSRMLNFRTGVRLVNPKYTMTSDTLAYSLASKTATFYGPTKIVSKGDVIYCENGWYNTNSGQARFGKNAYLFSNDQWLFGDTLFYDQKKGYGKADGHVQVLDSTERLVIKGKSAEYFEMVDQTTISGGVRLAKGYNDDSLWLMSEHLRSQYDTAGNRELISWKPCTMWSLDFQGKADSIIYRAGDSTITLLGNPVTWIESYQATADTIIAHLQGNRLQRAYLMTRSFMASPDSLGQYNQIKGSRMQADFDSLGRIARINVEGNGQSIYFVRNDKGGWIGMNTISSASIAIRMAEGKISRINFKGAPEAVMKPLSQTEEEEKQLPGFNWRQAEQPTGRPE